MRLLTSINKRLKTFEKEFTVFNNVQISKSAILYNYDLISKQIPGGLVIPVLKSNAYGHGLEQIATILKGRNPPYVAVDGYFEGLKVRQISKQPVLVTGSISNNNYSKIDPNNFAFVVHDVSTIKAMAATGKKFVIHIEIETGMNRHGVKVNDLKKVLKEIGRHRNIRFEGVMTHFADADNPDSDAFLQSQTEKFDSCIALIKSRGFSPKYFHIANSAGSVKNQSKYANTLRVGIALYGISPLEEKDKYSEKLHDLHPALSLTSTITKILKVSKNESVGYNRTFIANHNSAIGVLPLGYYEAIPRSLSNAGEVKWKNTYLPIAGRVCMNHTMIDLMGTNAEVGNQVIVISNNPTDRVSVSQICSRNNLSKYEFLVKINENIRRTIVD